MTCFNNQTALEPMFYSNQREQKRVEDPNNGEQIFRERERAKKW